MQPIFRTAASFAALAFLAACADSPTSVESASDTPASVASFNTNTGVTVWQAGQAAPAGFRINGNGNASTLACSAAGIKIDSPLAAGTLANGVIAYTVTNGVIAFTSSLPITHVAVKGGTPTNVYTLADDSYEAGGFVAPTNPRNGRAFGISHVTFCVGNPSPVVTLAAGGSFDRSFGWTIAKTADGSADASNGGLTMTQRYTVTLTKSAGSDIDHEAAGAVTVRNPSSVSMMLVGVALQIDGSTVTATCGATPMLVAAGASVDCTWGPVTTSATDYAVAVTVDNTPFTVPGLNAALSFQNVATTGGIAYTLDAVFNDTVTLSDDQITITDARHSASGAVSYSVGHVLVCGTGQQSFTNTATIEGDTFSASDAATVTFAQPACQTAVCAVAPAMTGLGSGFAWANGTNPTEQALFTQGGTIIKSDTGFENGTRTYIITGDYVSRVSVLLKAATDEFIVDLSVGGTATGSLLNNGGNTSNWTVTWTSRTLNSDGSYTYTVTVTGTGSPALSHATFQFGC
jgi:hypothetical protein